MDNRRWRMLVMIRTDLFAEKSGFCDDHDEFVIFLHQLQQFGFKKIRLKE